MITKNDSVSGRVAEMPPDPIGAIGLTEFSRLFRSGRMTSVQACRMYFDRIRALDPEIGAYAAVGETDAMERAAELDSLNAEGRWLGPLMGVPVAVKEIFRVPGLPFGAGTGVDISDVAPEHEGDVMRLLKEKGVVVLGTTRTTEFAAATINLRTPAPSNPWDAEEMRVCGGSSNGSAAALAAGLCAFSIGTDSGGSVRLPASLCGVVGYKPTTGLLPITGTLAVAHTFDTVGTFTRSVGDARVVSSALGIDGTHESQSWVPRLGRVPELERELDPRVSAAVTRAMSLLSAAGMRVVDISIPEVGEVAALFGKIFVLELISNFGRDRLVANRNTLDPVTWARIEPELTTDPRDIDDLQQRRKKLASQVAERISDVDALVSPTTPFTPTELSRVDDLARASSWNSRSGFNTRPANLFGLCGISLPVQQRGELPVGLQVLMPDHQDSKLLALASRVEAVVGKGPMPEVANFVSQKNRNSN